MRICIWAGNCIGRCDIKCWEKISYEIGPDFNGISFVWLYNHFIAIESTASKENERKLEKRS